MGMGFCRFDGCNESTSKDYDLFLTDQNIDLRICGLWQHYAEMHNVLPPKQARDVIMAADPVSATTRTIRWRSFGGPKRMSIYFVEKTDEGYDHEIGAAPDKEFIEKLELILNDATNR